MADWCRRTSSPKACRSSRDKHAGDQFSVVEAPPADGRYGFRTHSNEGGSSNLSVIARRAKGATAIWPASAGAPARPVQRTSCAAAGMAKAGWIASSPAQRASRNDWFESTAYGFFCCSA